MKNKAIIYIIIFFLIHSSTYFFKKYIIPPGIFLFYLIFLINEKNKFNKIINSILIFLFLFYSLKFQYLYYDKIFKVKKQIINANELYIENNSNNKSIICLKEDLKKEINILNILKKPGVIFLGKENEYKLKDERGAIVDVIYYGMNLRNEENTREIHNNEKESENYYLKILENDYVLIKLPIKKCQ